MYTDKEMDNDHIRYNENQAEIKVHEQPHKLYTQQIIKENLPEWCFADH